jgi:hypothetical protein
MESLRGGQKTDGQKIGAEYLVLATVLSVLAHKNAEIRT